MQDYLIECRRLRRENESLRARVAELEAEQAWHPASEPPETSDAKMVVYYDDCVNIGYFQHGMWYQINDGLTFSHPVTHWRDLPPMPEAKP